MYRILEILGAFVPETHLSEKETKNEDEWEKKSSFLQKKKGLGKLE